MHKTRHFSWVTVTIRSNHPRVEPWTLGRAGPAWEFGLPLHPNVKQHGGKWWLARCEPEHTWAQKSHCRAYLVRPMLFALFLRGHCRDEPRILFRSIFSNRISQDLIKMQVCGAFKAESLFSDQPYAARSACYWPWVWWTLPFSIFLDATFTSRPDG